jgi:hypothetical protein
MQIEAALAAVTADRALAARLRTVLAASGRRPDLPASWSAGGCLILAEALRRVVGGELLAVGEEGIDGEIDPATIDHIVIAVGGRYLDAHGAHLGEDALFEHLEEAGGFEVPVVVPITIARARKAQIPYDADFTEAVARALRERLRG